MEHFQPPPALDFSTRNLAENWRRFKQRFELYLEAIGKSNAKNKTKNAILLTVAGDEAINVYNTLALTDEDKETAAEGSVSQVIKHTSVIAKLDEYCAPRVNETYKQYVFRNRVQRSMEPVEKFITDLKVKVKTCNFGVLEDSLVRDQLVLGVSDVKLKERLLREVNLDLTKAEKLCLAAEAVSEQIRSLQSVGQQNTSEPRIDNIGTSNALSSRSRKRGGRAGGNGNATVAKPFDCRNCGTKHMPRSCPAFQTKCANCGRFNHFPSCCRNRKVNAVDVESVAQNKDGDADDCDEEFLITVIEDAGQVERGDPLCEWLVKVSINNRVITLKVDTGAQINVISRSALSHMSPRPKMLERQVLLKSYNGKHIPSSQGVK